MLKLCIQQCYKWRKQMGTGLNWFRLVILFHGYIRHRTRYTAEIKSLQTSNDCTDNSSPLLMTTNVSLIVFLVVIIKHEHLYSKGCFHWGLEPTDLFLTKTQKLQLLETTAEMGWYEKSVRKEVLMLPSAGSLRSNQPVKCPVYFIRRKFLWRNSCAQSLWLALMASCGSSDSPCRGFLNLLSCWCEHFQISFSHVNLLFWIMY